MIVRPRIDILPEAQKALWPLLKEVPKDFVLYGGTAVALRYGHRQSVDFDFFSSSADSNITETTDRLSFIKKFKRDDMLPYTESTSNSSQVIYKLDMGNDTPVEITFLRDPKFVGGSINAPHTSLDNGVKIASPMDLMATKINALVHRHSVKDIVDIGTLIKNNISFSCGFAYALALKKAELPNLISEYAYTLSALGTEDYYLSVMRTDKNNANELNTLFREAAGIIIKESKQVSIQKLVTSRLTISPHLHNDRGRDECER